MLDKKKTDPQLGEEVQAVLTSLGLQTPTKEAEFPTQHEASKIDVIEEHMRAILHTIGFDLSDDSMAETPRRVAKMFVNEKFWGLDPANFPKIMVVENKFKYDQMIIERDIPVVSCCEHHLEVIVGKATVAYIPKERVAGLSKLNRVVEYFSRRPQVQERLTQQIQKTLQYVLDTEDVAVSILASHNCVACRGVQHVGCDTVTNAFGGAFLDVDKARAEFLHFVKK